MAVDDTKHDSYILIEKKKMYQKTLKISTKVFNVKKPSASQENQLAQHDPANKRKLYLHCNLIMFCSNDANDKNIVFTQKKEMMLSLYFN